jgi:hypothetical protein
VGIFRYFLRARADEPRPGELRVITTSSGASSVDIADVVADERYKDQVEQTKKLAKLVLRDVGQRDGVEANGDRTPD